MRKIFQKVGENMASLEYCKTSNKSKLPFTFTTFISCQEYQISPAKSKKKKKKRCPLDVCFFFHKVTTGF